ncbi:MAG: metallophosphatase family protein [Lachnospiraceae bacterium]|nr:metallophosphatase family protein [Lachnospiraceae bacterium]
MKYAVISDIHGNYPALKAVLDDAGKQEISQFLFAGDYCLSGPWPDECISKIRSIPKKYVIRGNEESYLENLVGKDQSFWTDGQMQVSYWCYRNLSSDNLDYILNLPQKDEFDCNRIKIHMFHSSRDFLGTYPFYTWNSVEVAKRNRLTDADPGSVLAEMAREREQDPHFQETLDNLEKGIYIFGHSHIQCSYADKDKGIYLINPGSCGLPLDGIKDSVPYTILEIGDEGRISYEEKRVPFDKDSYISEVMLTSQFTEANVWTKVIIREQTTALEHMYFFLKFVEQYAKDIGDDIRPYSVETWERAFEKWNAVNV